MKVSKSIIGWVMYDFANSSFTTIIVSVIYSVYFRNVVVGSDEVGTALWGRAVSISMLMVGLSAPIFGAIADHSRSKKKFLFINTYLCVVFTCLLYFVNQGDIFKGMLFFIIANFGYNSANVFYNSFLSEIAPRSDLGKVSGWGWGVGYVGGLLSLFISLYLVNIDVRLVFPAIGLYFGLFALFTFFWLKEFRRPSKRTNYLKVAHHRISYTWKNISRLRELSRFIISYFIYNDGIIVVISFAAIYGATRFNMTPQQLIVYFIIAQLTSIVGALFFGYIIDKIGCKKTISITLIIWVFVVIGAFFSRSITEYYLVGLLAGIAIGSSQSSSRTMLALLTPAGKMTEFFGFYALTGKLASIFGPLVYGEIARITGSQRWSLLAVLFFFVSGGAILQTVNELKGKMVADQWQEE
ncbi:MAG: MFS transporter [Candidatus Cloacimonetes bacterium]|nr:MFS transporter [Candidatus Cloacimonadota bacterium]